MSTTLKRDTDASWHAQKYVAWDFSLSLRVMEMALPVDVDEQPSV